MLIGTMGSVILNSPLDIRYPTDGGGTTMNKLKNKFLTFKTKTNLTEYLDGKTSATDGYYGYIPAHAVVFIEDTGEIWHNGVYFSRQLPDLISSGDSTSTSSNKGIVYKQDANTFLYGTFNLWGNTFDGSSKTINGDVKVNSDWTFGGTSKGNGYIKNSTYTYLLFKTDKTIQVPVGNIEVSVGTISATQINNTSAYFDKFTKATTWDNIKVYSSTGTTQVPSSKALVTSVPVNAFGTSDVFEPWITSGSNGTTWSIGLDADGDLSVVSIDKTKSGGVTHQWKFTDDGLLQLRNSDGSYSSVLTSVVGTAYQLFAGAANTTANATTATSNPYLVLKGSDANYSNIQLKGSDEIGVSTNDGVINFSLTNSGSYFKSRGVYPTEIAGSYPTKEEAISGNEVSGSYSLSSTSTSSGHLVQFYTGAASTARYLQFYTWLNRNDTTSPLVWRQSVDENLNYDWRTILDSVNYNSYAAAKEHTHDYTDLTGYSTTANQAIVTTGSGWTLKTLGDRAFDSNTYLAYAGAWESTDTTKSADDATGMIFGYNTQGLPSSYGVVLTAASTISSDYKLQICGDGSANNGLYFRNRGDGGWKDWKKVAVSTDLDSYLLKTSTISIAGTSVALNEGSIAATTIGNALTSSAPAAYATEAGKTSYLRKNGYIACPNGGTYTTTTSPVTGFLRIKLPVDFTDTMISFYVDIFNYDPSLAVTQYHRTFKIAGYLSSADNSWHGGTAHALSNYEGVLANPPISFGELYGNPAVQIGYASANWVYPQVVIRDVYLGFVDYLSTDWDKDWIIDFSKTSIDPINFTCSEPAFIAWKASALTTKYAGNDIRPVYFTTGIPVACNYTLGADVPADAVFTDTTYSQATEATLGLTKLYTSTGDNTDGTMTQSAITSTLASQIPTVNNPTITITQGGTTKGSFTLNQSGNTTIALTEGSAAYSVATSDANGLMSSSDKSKLDGIEEGANYYTHPSYTAQSSGLYKVTVDSTGHVSAVASVTKSDITALGIPSSDTNTTYSAGTGISLSGTTINNSGVRSIATGSSNGTISVNTGGTTANVAVKGLGSAAYTASTDYATSGHTHSGYLSTSGGTVTGAITFSGNDSYGIYTSTNNYVSIGSSSYRFYRAYINAIYASTLYEGDTAISKKYAAIDHTHSGYLTSITKDMVTTALGYTPATEGSYLTSLGLTSDATASARPLVFEYNGTSIYYNSGIYCIPYSKSIYASSFYETSDITLKDVESYPELSIEKLAKIPIFNFTWKNSKDKVYLGTSAQEVQQILPNVVSGNEKLSVNYSVLGTVTGVAACRELIKHENEIETLKNRIQVLEEKIKSYENR